MGRRPQIIGLVGRIRRLACLGAAAVLVWGCAAAREDAEEAAISATLREAALAAQRLYDHAAAATHYQRLYERDPQNVEALLGMARNLRNSGTLKEAIKAVKQGLDKLGPWPELVLELGKAQIAASMLNDARETLTKARELAPKNWEVYSASGILYDRVGEFDEAYGEYRRALALSPENVAVLNNLALSLAQSGRLGEGIAILEKLVASENSTMQARQNLALLYGLKGEIQNAERLAREDLPSDLVIENLTTFRRLHD